MNHTRPHDGPGTDALFEAVKSSPPVAVTLGALSGMTIETWLALATLIYVVLQAFYLVDKWVRERRERRTAAAAAAAAGDPASGD